MDSTSVLWPNLLQETRRDRLADPQLRTLESAIRANQCCTCRGERMSRESMLAELELHLTTARVHWGAVDPHFSYFRRLLDAAEKDEHFLADLYNRVAQEGGF